MLFDLDGTILNTAPGILKSIEYVIEKMELPPLTDAEKAGMIGPPIEKSFQKVYKISEKLAKEAAKVFREVYQNRFLFEAEEYLHIRDFISLLKENGILVAIATYKRDRYAQKLFSHFGLTDQCDFCLGSDDNGILTKKDIIEICLEHLGCSDRTEALLIGDTIHDYIGAQEAGIDFWGVTYGFGLKTPEDRQACCSERFFDSADDLVSYWKHSQNHKI